VHRLPSSGLPVTPCPSEHSDYDFVRKCLRDTCRSIGSIRSSLRGRTHVPSCSISMFPFWQGMPSRGHPIAPGRTTPLGMVTSELLPCRPKVKVSRILVRFTPSVFLALQRARETIMLRIMFAWQHMRRYRCSRWTYVTQHRRKSCHAWDDNNLWFCDDGILSSCNLVDSVWITFIPDRMHCRRFHRASRTR